MYYWKNIEDYWNVHGEKELSDAWTGFTRCILLNERPPDGCTWSGGETYEETNRGFLSAKKTSSVDAGASNSPGSQKLGQSSVSRGRCETEAKTQPRIPKSGNKMTLYLGAPGNGCGVVNLHVQGAPGNWCEVSITCLKGCKEFLFHRGCSFDVCSILRAGLVAGGREREKRDDKQSLLHTSTPVWGQSRRRRTQLRLIEAEKSTLSQQVEASSGRRPLDQLGHADCIEKVVCQQGD